MLVIHPFTTFLLLSRIAFVIMFLGFAVNVAGRDVDLTYTQPPSMAFTSYFDASLALRPDTGTSISVVTGHTRSDNLALRETNRFQRITMATAKRTSRSIAHRVERGTS